MELGGRFEDKRGQNTNVLSCVGNIYIPTLAIDPMVSVEEAGPRAPPRRHHSLAFSYWLAIGTVYTLGSALPLWASTLQYDRTISMDLPTRETYQVSQYTFSEQGLKPDCDTSLEHTGRLLQGAALRGRLPSPATRVHKGG